MKWLFVALTFLSWNPPSVDLLLASLPPPELQQVMTCYDLQLASRRLGYFAEARDLAGEGWNRWQWFEWLSEARDNRSHPFHEQATWLTRNGEWDLVALGKTYQLLALAEAEAEVAKEALQIGGGEWAGWFRRMTRDEGHPFNERWLPVLQMRQAIEAELKFWELCFLRDEDFEELLEEYGLENHFAFIDRWADPTNLEWQARYPAALPLFEAVTERIRERIAIDPPPSVPDAATIGWEVIRNHQLQQLACNILVSEGSGALVWQWEEWTGYLKNVAAAPEHPLHRQVREALKLEFPLLDEEEGLRQEELLYYAMEEAFDLHLPDLYLPLYERWMEEGISFLSPRARHALGALIYTLEQ